MKRKIYVLHLLFWIIFVPAYGWGISIQGPGGYTRARNFPLRIQGAATDLIKVVYNAVPMTMKSYDSYRILSLRRGLNTIVVADLPAKSSSTERDTLTVYADVPPIPLKIIHTWDTPDNYVDIYVKEPTGEECFWRHRETELGGVLDIGSDTVGYGPQIYTMPGLNPGVYEIFVGYYEGSKSKLTEITTYVILHEGTEKEQRQVFQAVLTIPGEKIFIGKVELK